jgi:hypothetical protein
MHKNGAQFTLLMGKALIGRQGGNFSVVSTPNDGVKLRRLVPPERII